jgi:hypothetical protein
MNASVGSLCSYDHILRQIDAVGANIAWMRKASRQTTPWSAAGFGGSKETSHDMDFNQRVWIRKRFAALAGKLSPGISRLMIAMLRGPRGVTIAAMTDAAGWQQHSVRGFLAAWSAKSSALPCCRSLPTAVASIGLPMAPMPMPQRRRSGREAMRQPRSPVRIATIPSLNDEIAHLRDLDLNGLRARWQSTFR